jgi:hypothetical protein
MEVSGQLHAPAALPPGKSMIMNDEPGQTREKAVVAYFKVIYRCFSRGTENHREPQS